MKKITRNDINKKNMVALSYCQCQKILNMFADDYKIGCNTGINGWNYDLYNINGISVVTGYNVPYKQYSNKKIKNELVSLENKIRNEKICFSEENYKKWQKEFLKIFEQ